MARLLIFVRFCPPLDRSGGRSRYILNLPAEEKAADLWVGKKLVSGAGDGGFSGDQYVSYVGEFEALLGVLFDHDNGFTIPVLQIVEDFEHHVDEAWLKPD